jgi:hypothetical protein
MVSGTGLSVTEELLEMVRAVGISTELLMDPVSGVYLAKDGSTSVGYYAQSGSSSWSKSMVSPSNCMALAEVVNLPSKFVSQNPHYVVKDTHWIMW